MLFSATLNASVEDLAALALVRSFGSDLGVVSEARHSHPYTVTPSYTELHGVTPSYTELHLTLNIAAYRSHAATPQITVKVKPQRIHASPVNAVAQTLEQETGD